LPPPISVSVHRVKVLGVIADSGFYLKPFAETLENEKLTYISAVRLMQPLQRQIWPGKKSAASVILTVS
jgi:hypothetical protein